MPRSLSSIADQGRSRMEAHTPSTSGGLRTAFLDRVESLPELRQIPWRAGHELPPEVPIESLRVQQRGALAVATRGKVAEEKCTHCAGGFGRFSECVSLGDWFQGACAGCVYTSKGHKCSLRSGASGNQDEDASRIQISTPDPVNQQTGAKSNPTSSRKRKARVSASSALTPSHQTWNEDEQRRLSGGRFSDMDSLVQVDIARNDIAEKWATPEQGQQDQRSATNGPSQPQLQLSPTHNLESKCQNSGASSRPSDLQKRNHLYERAYQSQSSGQPPQKRFKPSQTQAEDARSLTPGSTVWPKQPGMANPQPTPVIDTLPKAKQRQIYGLVSGLQGGINHLEKQLSNLKDLLGIDNDEDDLAA